MWRLKKSIRQTEKITADRTFFRKPLAKREKIWYNRNVRYQTVKRGHTSRGRSGALNLKSAVAGVDSSSEGRSLANEALSLC